MDLAKEIEELAMNFEACHKTLSAMGDETRQHIILEMMRMDYQKVREEFGSFMGLYRWEDRRL